MKWWRFRPGRPSDCGGGGRVADGRCSPGASSPRRPEAASGPRALSGAGKQVLAVPLRDCMTDAAFLLQQRGLRWISICPKDAPIGCAVWPGDIVKQDLLLLPTATDAPEELDERSAPPSRIRFRPVSRARTCGTLPAAGGQGRWDDPAPPQLSLPTRTKRLPASADSSVEPALARPLEAQGRTRLQCRPRRRPSCRGASIPARYGPGPRGAQSPDGKAS